MPPSHNGIAPVLSEDETSQLFVKVLSNKRTGPLWLPGSIPGGGVNFYPSTTLLIIPITIPNPAIPPITLIFFAIATFFI